MFSRYAYLTPNTVKLLLQIILEVMNSINCVWTSAQPRTLNKFLALHMHAYPCISHGKAKFCKWEIRYENWNITHTWIGERPKWAAKEALDCGEMETMTAFPLLILDRNSSKLCFSSITVSAEVIHPLHVSIKQSQNKEKKVKLSMGWDTTCTRTKNGGHRKVDYSNIRTHETLAITQNGMSEAQ